MKRFSVWFVVSLVCSGVSLTAAPQNRPELVAPASQVSNPNPTPGSSFVRTQAKPSPAAVSNQPSGSRGSVRANQTAQTPRALLPLRPPRVSYNAGQLSIVAENSTLADVLSAIRQKTGAVIESPPSAARERVVISIGPAPANDVLTALLNGSKFDYIILGAQRGSGAPQHVILREQQSLPPGGQPAQAAVTTPVRHLPPEAPEPMEEEEFVPEPEVTEEIQSEPAVDHGQQQSEQQQQPEQPQIKTPEQMLEELKRMQQQQLQQQQQPGTQPQGTDQQQQQNQQQPQDQQQQPPQTVPDSEQPNP